MNHWKFCLGLGLALLAGCAREPSPTPGGTAGQIRSGDARLSDIQVTAFRCDGSRAEPLGIGVTAPDGRFRLTTLGASGPLHLVPGEYRFTLESVGAVPLRFPPAYAHPEHTPLIATWSGDGQLDFEVPLPVSEN